MKYFACYRKEKNDYKLECILTTGNIDLGYDRYLDKENFIVRSVSDLSRVDENLTFLTVQYTPNLTVDVKDLFTSF